MPTQEQPYLFQPDGEEAQEQDEHHEVKGKGLEKRGGARKEHARHKGREDYKEQYKVICSKHGYLLFAGFFDRTGFTGLTGACTMP